MECNYNQADNQFNVWKETITIIEGYTPIIYTLLKKDFLTILVLMKQNPMAAAVAFTRRA